MKYLITESQYRLLSELSKSSYGVEEFLDMVKSTKGMLKHLGFRSHKDLEDYIQDGDNDDLDELKKEAEQFDKQKK